MVVDMNRRREALPDSLPRSLVITDDVSIDILRQLNKHRCRAMYRCPICLSCFQDPPVSVPILNSLVAAGAEQRSLLSTASDDDAIFCEGDGSWDGFFAM